MRKSALLLVAVFAVACEEQKAAPPPPPAPAATPPPPAAPPPAPAADKCVTIGYSDWVGWHPWTYVKEKKLVDKYKACANFKYFDSYVESINALGAGTIDGLAVTVSDTIMTVANSQDGSKFKIVLVNDLSNGGDQFIVDGTKYKSIKDLKGKEIRLETGTVSQFLMAKAAQSAGMTLKDFRIVHTAADETGNLFATGAAKAIVTWNPNARNAKKNAKAPIKPLVLFDSTKVYGLIPDVLTVNTQKMSKEQIQAVVDAWFDAVAAFQNPATHAEALQVMAKSAGITPDDYQGFLKETQLFTDINQAVAFLSKQGIKTPSGTTVNAYHATAELAKFLNTTADGEGNPFAKKMVDADSLIDASYQEAALKR
jgi:NitT/TauT family transport system substrate-binding protein